MYATRTRLRALLKALIAERSDSALLYIPHGESGMRRMIAALLVMRPIVENDPLAEQIRAMRPPIEDGDPLAEDIAWFHQEFPE